LVTAKTQLVGLLGDPVEHSLSPAMLNAAFGYLGLDMAYLAFRVEQDNLAAAVEGIRALGFKGANITAPHKQAVMPYLDRLSPEAARLEAVNTVINRNGKLVGENTDWKGCKQALTDLSDSDASRERVLILGAGGAARAAAYALADMGVRWLTVANRSRERALKIVSVLKGTGLNPEIIPLDVSLIEREIKNATLLINALPLELKGEKWEWLYRPPLLRGKFVLDLRYRAEGTCLVHRAEGRGATRACDGKGMLLYQGAEAFTLFTGQPAPLEVMRAALEKASSHINKYNYKHI